MKVASVVALLASAVAAASVLAEDVMIHHFQFTPSDLTVYAGQTVVWTNHDDMEHTVTSQTGPGTLVHDGLFDSGLLSRDDTFRVTFSTPGVYWYFCRPHGSSMQGVVRVEACPADFNGDTQTDFFDYLDFAAAFDAEDPSADFNGDLQVDFFDYLDFAEAFDRGCA